MIESDITPTMRVLHTASQLQPVPPSQLATPEGGFNYYKTSVSGIFFYYYFEYRTK